MRLRTFRAVWMGCVLGVGLMFSCSSTDREFGSGQPGDSGAAGDDTSGAGGDPSPQGGVPGTGGSLSHGGQPAAGDPNLPDTGGAGAGSDAPPLCESTAAAARLVGPPTSSIVTSRRPTLTWELGDDCGPLTVELCADRACTEVLESVDVDEDEQRAAPSRDLPSGVVFWRVRGSGVSSLVWQFNVGVGTPVDTSWGTLPDFNGDGFGDVAVGTSNGTVYVYYGAKAGLAAAPTPLSIVGGAAFAFGWLMASAGDVNGDGFTDLLVGAAKLPSGGSGSKLYVFAGGTDGVGTEPFATLDFAGLIHGGDPQYPGTGSAMRGGADLNRDGYADFVVSTPATGNSVGDVTTFFGSAKGVTKGTSIIGPGATAAFGRSLAFCDLDGDGPTDLLVGAPDAKDNQAKAAPVVVLNGTGSGLQLGVQLTAAAGFGATVACGDYGHDGYPEVVTAWPTSDARAYQDGDAWLFPNAGALSKTGASLPGQASGSYIQSGQVMATIGDMNGDGVQELALTQYSGRGMRVFFKPGSSKVADTVALDGAQDTQAIAFTSSDVNGDGLVDLISGSLTTIEVFLGSKTSRIVTPTMLRIDAPAGAEAFGQSFAASL
jgi:hypothetical protein